MKKLLILSAILLASCSPKIEHFSYNEGINVTPIPAEMTQSEGEFTLTPNTVIVAATPESASAVGLLSAKIKSSTGYDLTVADKRPAANFIEISTDRNLDLKAEGYTLSSTADGVVICGKDDSGAFYGAQTLLQLFPAQIESKEVVKNTEWVIPAVEIKDFPRFMYRGLMLDVCRHFFDVDFIKKQLDVLAMYKINRFHWHLTEDQAWRIEIKKYPKLTELGSLRTEGDGSTYGPYFYTQEQIKEVVAYATERHIDVIPEIELPGHALAALTAYPEFSCTGGPFTPRYIWGIEEDAYCAGNDKTFDFLEDVIDEVIALFPSQYIHIGGDECLKDRWEECPKCQARIAELGIKPMVDEHGFKHSNEEQLQSYFISRIGKYIASRGKKMIGWDEILEGGLAEGAIVMAWRGAGYGAFATEMGHQCIMTPNPDGFYLDHYQGAEEVEENTIGGFAPWTKLYNYDPINEDFTPEMEDLVMGVQGNMWTEYRLSDQSTEYMIYPRVMAIAELGWTPKNRKNVEEFDRRLYNIYARLDFHGADYHVPMAEGLLTRNAVYTGDSIAIEFTNSKSGLPMVYTLDGTEPTAKSTVYTAPIVIKDAEAEIKIASVLPTGKLSVVRSIPVKKTTMAEPVEPAVTPESKELKLHVQKSPNQTIKVRTASGLFLNETEFANAQFGADTLVDNFQNGVDYDMKKPSLSIYEGYIELPEDGIYVFSSDMAQLWIAGEQIINNTKKVSRHSSHKAQKALKAGKHAYKMVVNNNVTDGWPTIWSELAFYYQLPSGGDFRRVSSEVISY